MGMRSGYPLGVDDGVLIRRMLGRIVEFRLEACQRFGVYLTEHQRSHEHDEQRRTIVRLVEKMSGSVTERSYEGLVISSLGCVGVFGRTSISAGSVLSGSSWSASY